MSTRKDFLVASSIALSVAACTTAGRGQSGGATFTLSEFDNLASKAARHRHCLGISAIAAGDGLYGVKNLLTAYTESLHVPLSDVYIAGVFYHGTAVAMALGDKSWNDLIVPHMSSYPVPFRNDLNSVQITKGNPFLHKNPSRGVQDASIESLVERGGVFFVCNNSLYAFASAVAPLAGKDAQSVYQGMLNDLAPGCYQVPAGVWAINALQEKHFTYLHAA